MGLFDLFSRNKGEPGSPKGISPREFARLARLAGNKMAHNYDRQEAIDSLCRLKSTDGAKALLRRFDFSMEPSIVDQEEKEVAAQGLAEAGQQALPAIRAYCARAESLTWPLRVLHTIVGDEGLPGELLELLEAFDTEYTRNPEPKIQVISLLAEHASPAARESVEPFLTDVNENVRFHAVGTLLTVDGEAASSALAEALLEEESLRVKNRIARGLVEGAWPLEPALASRCAEALPPGFRLQEEGRVVGEPQ